LALSCPHARISTCVNVSAGQDLGGEGHHPQAGGEDDQDDWQHRRIQLAPNHLTPETKLSD